MQLIFSNINFLYDSDWNQGVCDARWNDEE